MSRSPKEFYRQDSESPPGTAKTWQQTSGGNPPRFDAKRGKFVEWWQNAQTNSEAQGAEALLEFHLRELHRQVKTWEQTLGGNPPPSDSERGEFLLTFVESLFLGSRFLVLGSQFLVLGHWF